MKNPLYVAWAQPSWFFSRHFCFCLFFVFRSIFDIAPTLTRRSRWSQWSHGGTPPPADPHQPCSKPCAARQGHGSPAPVPRFMGMRRAHPSAMGTYVYPSSVRHKLSWRFPASSRRVIAWTTSSPAGRGARPS